MYRCRQFSKAWTCVEKLPSSRTVNTLHDFMLEIPTTATLNSSADGDKGHINRRRLPTKSDWAPGRLLSKVTFKTTHTQQHREANACCDMLMWEIPKRLSSAIQLYIGDNASCRCFNFSNFNHTDKSRKYTQKHLTYQKIVFRSSYSFQLN